MEFGEAVKDRRTRLGHSQSALADLAGVSKAMLSEIESGKKNPTLRVACHIAGALDCQISDLLDLPADIRFETLRASDRRVLIDPESGVERHLLSPQMVQHGIQMLLYVFPPQSLLEFDAHGRGCLANITCLDGQLRVNACDTEAQIGPQESVNFEASAAHSIRNLQDAESRAIVVLDSTARGTPAPFETLDG